MGSDTSQAEGPRILASCTGDDCEALIIQWARENGYTRKEVKILTDGETVWVEKRT